MLSCKKKFWIENPFDLFCSINIIPLKSMSLEEQMNCFSRFVIILFFLMLIFTPNSITSFIFLFISLLFIIILYYIKKRTMDNYKENYQNSLQIERTHNDPKYNKRYQPKLRELSVTTKDLDNSVLKQKNNVTCLLNKEILLSPNQNFVSPNQRITGPPNPKTLIQPIITTPLADLDGWKANNLINHSHINTQSKWDTYLSGYDVTTLCGSNEFIVPYQKTIKKSLDTIIEDVEFPVQSNEIPYGKNHNSRFSAVREKNVTEGYQGPVIGKEGSPTGTNTFQIPIHLQHVTPNNPKTVSTETSFTEKLEYPYLVKDKQYYDKKKSTNQIKVCNDFGLVNTECGYNPKQVTKSNLPSNLATGYCERDEVMKDYNKNLFTQNIQPDIYSRSEIIEPINSNIGISFTQQFGPKTCSVKDGKGLTCIQHDSNIFHPEAESYELNTMLTEADVYDPRFYGYGTSYRSYTDKKTGQPRFYYDDVNAIRMPNYLVRSNIDFAKYADSYGPLHNNNKHGNKHHSNIRDLANDTFLQSSLQHRTELQERLMSKRNNELWQLRKYPIRTFGGKKW